MAVRCHCKQVLHCHYGTSFLFRLGNLRHRHHCYSNNFDRQSIMAIQVCSPFDSEIHVMLTNVVLSGLLGANHGIVYNNPYVDNDLIVSSQVRSDTDRHPSSTGAP